MRVDIEVLRHIDVVQLRFVREPEHPQQHRIRRQDASIGRALINAFQHAFE